jgi:uncharacterized protein YbjT (DUF2867 family)
MGTCKVNLITRKMRIAILGGTGQIGSVLTKDLITTFPKAEILSYSRTGGNENHHKKFNISTDDWTVLGKLDYIVNAVGIIEENNENTFEKVHIDLVKDILHNHNILGNPMIIHVSVLGADPASKSQYAATKGKADQILIKSPKWNIIRPSFVCTPDTTIVKKIRMMKDMSKWLFGILPMPANFLISKFQPVMASDLSELISQCISQNLNQEIIYATGEETYTLRDWINLAGKGKIKIIGIPNWLIKKPFRLFIFLFPRIINKDQYELIGRDNSYNDNVKFRTILKRKPLSTIQFWNQQL